MVNNILGRSRSLALPDSFYVGDCPIIIANEINKHFSNVGEYLAQNFAMDGCYVEYLSENINTRFILNL